MNLRYFLRLFSISAFMLTSLSASAAGAVVAEGLGVSITVDDLNADAMRLAPEARPRALSQPGAVQQAATNLFIRRALAAEAERAGLENDPQVAATLRLLRDRVLSDAQLAKFDAAHKPTDDAIDTAARAAYKAEPERFRTGEQIRASHILIAGNTEKAKENAEKVLADLKAGADFATVAREKSADLASGALGGDLGYFEPNKMVPEFAEAVQGLKNPGDMTGLVQSQFGWHIIKFEGRRPGGLRTYEDVRDELRQVVAGQLQSDARLQEARRLAEAARFNQDAIDAFSAPYRK